MISSLLLFIIFISQELLKIYSYSQATVAMRFRVLTTMGATDVALFIVFNLIMFLGGYFLSTHTKKEKLLNAKIYIFSET